MTVGDIVVDRLAGIIDEVVNANVATARIRKALIRYEVMETIIRQRVLGIIGGRKANTVHLQHEIERPKTGIVQR